MTKEEAIKILKELPNNILGVVLPFDIDFDYTQALDMAIKALEQETVSRESYEHEYFLRKELDFKAARLEKQIAEQESREVTLLNRIKEAREELYEASHADADGCNTVIDLEDAFKILDKLIVEVEETK